ncbi:Hsp20 family protein [Lichenifustis flavocetrariae]|uniref:Hsp20 family protein n=1 Tax=Lichenifustis flavocetrariae TaxID=2949735 RepID=A0AA42CI91_9HYPH|nr:Hsp20 family protein [Lichenifustis flavocetrariae]MCW6508343.1 Hsp20 family protein [Lichenifustis flavocetrariae]
MRTFDFAPLYRSTVGFERLFDMLDSSAAGPDWPPYDIERKGENDYRISMAVAGFGQGDIELTQHGNTLLVSGQRKAKEKGRDMLHQGIASRAFKLTFNLADHVKVVGADLHDGILSVELTREVPEQLKPRRIEIGTSTKAVTGQDNEPVEIDSGDQRRVA